MQIKIEIDQISYSDIAVSALPYAKKNAAQWGDSITAVISAMTDVPAREIREQLDTITADRIRELVDAVPAEKIQKVLSSTVAENSSKLLNMVNTLSDQERLGITVSAFSVSEDMTATLEVSRIDYPLVVERFLPAVKKSLLNSGSIPSLLKPMIEKASTQQVCTLLDRIPGNKESVLAMLINQNQQKLISKVQSIAKKKGVRLTVAAVEVRA